MFTKLNMVDNQPVFTNLIECHHDDVIIYVTTDRFRLEFRVFGTCEYYNLRSLHLMFTKLNRVDNKPVFTNLIECRHDDVISDVTLDRFRL